MHVNVSAEITEAECIIVIGAPEGRHTPRVDILQPTNYPTIYLIPPLSSPMVPSRNLLFIMRHISPHN